MELDVVIPAARPATVERALQSLSLGSRAPDAVSIVSNEVEPALRTFGLPVRILRFESVVYPFGVRDLALRRNVGIYASRCSHVMTFDDDQVASRAMLAETVRLLEDEPCVWGHHRYIDFDGWSVEQLVDLAAERGRPREHPPNAWHLYHSCYGGLCAADRELLEEVGGYDMIFSGRQAGEDQQLGWRIAQRRHASDRVYVFEPPFAFHPERMEPWSPPRRTNLCPGSHRLERVSLAGVEVESCRDCPHFATDIEMNLLSVRPLLPYDHSLVEVEEIVAAA
jgi:hypothetical protein